LRRSGGLQLILNFPSRQIRVCIYVSEVKAQAIAVKLRQKAPIGNVLTILRGFVDRGLVIALGRGGHGRLKIIHETVSPEQALGGAIRRIPPLLLNRVRGHLREWLLKGLLEFLKSKATQFIAAADAPADGVTLIATIDNPPGWDLLRQALRGRVASLAGLKMSGGPPVVKIDVVAGHSNG